MAGLTNIGNTCFLNAALQCLSCVNELNTVVLPAKNADPSVERLLTEEYFSLRALMAKHASVQPFRFVNGVKYVAARKGQDLFAGNNQNDVSEFLMFIVDCFHKATARKIDLELSNASKDVVTTKCYNMFKELYTNDFSNIIPLFYGIHISTITSTIDKQAKSLKPEPFFILSLPIEPSHTTLYDCLDLYCCDEELQGENAWFNDETNAKEDAVRSIRVWAWPKVLVVDLKRNAFLKRKINQAIDIPMLLDVTKYTVANKKVVFELFATCNHHGTNQGGHYTASVKRDNVGWLFYNDDHVTRAPFNGADAYCLFYRKKIMS